MATNVKTNGNKKGETVTTKATVQKKLAEEAKGSKATPESKPALNIPGTKKPLEAIVNLDERINRFEKLRGIANQRERLVQTLTELSRFNYNQDGSSSFYLRDASGAEFKTINSNLIKLVATQLQNMLETRKTELEKELLEFQL